MRQAWLEQSVKGAWKKTENTKDLKISKYKISTKKSLEVLNILIEKAKFHSNQSLVFRGSS